MTEKPILLWFRNDLRLTDHPALTAAAQSGQPVLCLYVFDEHDAGPHGISAAQNWWRHHSLKALQQQLNEMGGTLILRRGSARQLVPDIAQTIEAQAVYWTRRYMHWEIDIDDAVRESLEDKGITAKQFKGSLLTEPEAITTKSGGPYRVFTPYWKSLKIQDNLRAPCPKVETLNALSTPPPTDLLDDWSLLPTKPDWAKGFAPLWTPGEDGAHDRLTAFLEQAIDGYGTKRDRPDLDHTSRLSPHLHFGEISPATIWKTVHGALDDGRIPPKDAEKFLSEVAWREFSYQLIFHHPDMHHDPLSDKFNAFEWDENPDLLAAWQKGQTGYPIVDAGMRQLWRDGWMHNRVRMIVASFLIKDLLIHWRDGMAWFWDTLLDADPANNTASWQWVAGCGADAAPYFRIFNPITQGEKFDPDGAYIRTYVPELKDLPTKYLHSPWTAPPMVLKSAGVSLGETYPAPIVDHKTQREEALARYEATK